MFDQADKIAIEQNCSQEIWARIAKEQADKLYQNWKYKEAMDFYMKTIGEEAPSYVIEKYLDVQNL